MVRGGAMTWRERSWLESCLIFCFAGRAAAGRRGANYTAVGGTRFGYRGDIRFLGLEGPLPLDRPHQVKISGNYSFNNGLGIGVGLNLGSGKPLTALASLPIYDNDSEIPETARGEGFDTVDGFKKRTPMEAQLDLQASYALNLGGSRRLTLLADAFRRMVAEDLNT